ncbi:MAG: hypothetical protein LBT79_07930 [Elusimicrobiota bacterium]|jgi:hypothetical protein|nr:hypothetical protein [Elusimicrobiota bacterium]
MAAISLTGADTIKINSRIFADLADGDHTTVDMPNNIANVKIGKDGNALYALNGTGLQTDMIIRLVRGSADDIYLNNLLAKQKQDFAGFILMTSEFIKRVGDGAGKITADTYVLSGGIFTKLVPTKSNAEGDTEQSVSIYAITFTNSDRRI